MSVRVAVCRLEGNFIKHFFFKKVDEISRESSYQLISEGSMRNDILGHMAGVLQAGFSYARRLKSMGLNRGT